LDRGGSTPPWSSSWTRFEFLDVIRLVQSRPHRVHHGAHELVRMFQHHPIRNPQQTYAKGSQGVFLNSVFPHLVRLRVNTAVKLDGQSMFEAVEIDDTAFSSFQQ
jgi:hypothetical protein